MLCIFFLTTILRSNQTNAQIKQTGSLNKQRDQSMITKNQLSALYDNHEIIQIMYDIA